MGIERPTNSGGASGSWVTTPLAATMVQLLGSTHHEGVALTHDEFRAIKKLYGYTEETQPFAKAGADRNAFRHAAADGLRLVAWLSHRLPEGADPLKELIRLASDSGWDVDPSDLEWAENEE